jgi:hypothetical protein
MILTLSSLELLDLSPGGDFWQKISFVLAKAR